MFDHEKLDAYQLELRFIAWVTPLLEEVRLRRKAKPAKFATTGSGQPVSVCTTLRKATASVNVRCGQSS